MALRSSEEEDFDIALVDLKMPKMNGIEVLKALRAKSPNMYVVIITAYATIETAIEAMKLGAFDYLRKPFKSKDLGDVINKIKEEKRFEKRLIEQKTVAPEKDVYNSFKKRSKGKKAMVFTTEDPEEIERRYRFSNIPFYMITSKKGKGTLSPTELDRLSKIINKFIKREPGSVVLIQGIDMLIRNNSKVNFNEFIKKLNESFKRNNCTLIISANPLDLDKEDIFELEDILSGNYTQIMSEALANPIRRDILRYLARVEGASFSQILGNIPENDSAKFSFHVKKLISYDVIKKDGKGMYTLTKRGNNLISILKNIEEERIKESPSHLLVSPS
jgi:DNA-binding response OmpR family regulator/predicted transcriptional regulator